MWITGKVKDFLLGLFAGLSALLGFLALFFKLKSLRLERDRERELRKRQEALIRKAKENVLRKAMTEARLRDIEEETKEKLQKVQRSRGKDLLQRLNRMFPGLILVLSLSCAEKEYVYVEPVFPSIPPEPVYFPVQWRTVDNLYCLDEENAQNLLKNIELMKGYQKKLKTILEGYSEKP